MARSGEKQWKFGQGITEIIPQIHFTPHGHRLATLGGSAISIWNGAPLATR
jgi:hypothetical protein